MDILYYMYPKVGGLELSFSTFDTPKVLVEEAIKRGFYGGNTKANDLFSKWFFSGLETGEIAPREDGDKVKINKALLFARALMGSFTPSQENKEAVCALIFSETLLWKGEKLT